MRKTIKLECTKCSASFDKEVKEYKRRLKQSADARFFCSAGCAASIGNAERPPVLNLVRNLPFREKKKRYGYRHQLAGTINAIRKRARQKCVPCSIGVVILADMLEAQEWKCFYTGRQMDMNDNSLYKMTVDRIIPANGYVKDNIVLCCRWVNMAKDQGTFEALLENAIQLVEHHNQ